MEEVVYKPIGTIRTPFRVNLGVPVQPRHGKSINGKIEIEPEYADGLKDLDGFSHIILIFDFHLSQGFSLRIKPHWDDQLHGVFATRSPRRPNPIGISVVKLIKVEGCALFVQDVDMVDGTPLLDIKPYVPRFDSREKVKTGWITGRLQGDRCIHTLARPPRRQEDVESSQ